MVEVVHSNTVHHYVVKDYNLFSRNFILIFLAILLLRRSLVFQTNLALWEIVFNNFWYFILLWKMMMRKLSFASTWGGACPLNLLHQASNSSYILSHRSMDAEYGVVLHILDSCFLLLNRIFMAVQSTTKMVWILFFMNILLNCLRGYAGIGFELCVLSNISFRVFWRLETVFYKPEAYSKPYQTSKTDFFAKSTTALSLSGCFSDKWFLSTFLAASSSIFFCISMCFLRIRIT